MTVTENIQYHYQQKYREKHWVTVKRLIDLNKMLERYPSAILIKKDQWDAQYYDKDSDTTIFYDIRRWEEPGTIQDCLP